MFELPKEPKFYDYESPISRIISDAIAERMKAEENEFLYSVHQTIGYSVDKEELIKALNYDRGQYEKGYNDGLKAGYEKAKTELLEKITESIEKGFE